MYTHLGCTDFVECHENERLQKAAERQIIAISERNQQQERHLGNKDSQAEKERPLLFRCEIEHEKIWGEVMTDVSSCHMVEVGLLEKLVAIATRKDRKCKTAYVDQLYSFI